MPNIGWDTLVAAAGEAGKAFEPLEPNNYNFVVSEATVGESKTGKKSIGITAIIESGPSAKRKVWNTWYISPENANALAYFFREMKIFGLDRVEFFGKGPSDQQIIDGLVNKRFIGTVVQKEYPEGSGKIKNEIDGFLPPIGAATGNAAATASTNSGPGVGSSVPTVPTVAAAAPQVYVPTIAPAPQAPSVGAPQVAVAAPVSANPWETQVAPAPVVPQVAAPSGPPAPPGLG